MRPPSNNPVTQTKHGQFHAVDYSARPDPIIYAPEKLTFFVYLQNAGDAGNNLQATGKSGRHGFCHLEECYLQPGQTVLAGTPIGKMGYTGKTVPSGPAGRHLHWVLYRNGAYVYPPDYITEPFKEEEPMFNEGDRININKEFYGKDLGLHRDLVGKKTFKEALYDIFDKSKDYKANAKVNEGDVVNYFRALVGHDPSDGDKKAFKGLPHKVLLYGLLERSDTKDRLGSIGAVNVVEVPEGTLIKIKGE